MSQLCDDHNKWYWPSASSDKFVASVTYCNANILKDNTYVTDVFKTIQK